MIINQVKFYVQKMSAYYVCCKYLNALPIKFIREAKIMDPDQIAPKCAVSSGYKLFAIFWPPNYISRTVSRQ